jgi:hypothetical protein
MPSNRPLSVSVNDTTLPLPFPLSNIPRRAVGMTELSGFRARLNRFAILPKTLVRLPPLSGDGGRVGDVDTSDPVERFVGLEDLESLRVRGTGRWLC